MKKKTPNSNSKSTKARKTPNSISRELNRVLDQFARRMAKDMSRGHQAMYLNYDESRNFCHHFIDSMVHEYIAPMDKLDIERHQTATKEIMLDILREKYQLPNREAAILLLHAGIELLDLVDADKEGMDF